MKILIVTVVFLGLTQAQAAIVCEGKSNMGLVKVTLGEDKATVEGGALEKPQIITGLTHRYDGHMTSMTTGPGFAMKFESHYGCIRDAVIMTNVRESLPYIDVLEVPVCRGGSTNDSSCGAK